MGWPARRDAGQRSRGSIAIIGWEGELSVVDVCENVVIEFAMVSYADDDVSLEAFEIDSTIVVSVLLEVKNV